MRLTMSINNLVLRQKIRNPTHQGNPATIISIDPGSGGGGTFAFVLIQPGWSSSSQKPL